MPFHRLSKIKTTYFIKLTFTVLHDYDQHVGGEETFFVGDYIGMVQIF